MADEARLPTIIRKLHDSTVRTAIEMELITLERMPPGYYVQELTPRLHGGWIVVLDPRDTPHTPPALENE